jgi:hypothetical protein
MIVEGARRALSRVPAYHGLECQDADGVRTTMEWRMTRRTSRTRWWSRKTFRRNVDPRTDELRAMFVANPDRIRSWLDDWYFPEVA